MAICGETLMRRLAILVAAIGIALMGAGGSWVEAQEASGTAAPANEPVSAPAAPEILRGSMPPQPAVEPAAGSAEPLIAAGDRVWFVDRESGRLTGCRLINTIYVDTQAIRCTERRLPRGALVRD